MNAGAKIKELRLEKGLTLEQLGDLVGVGKSTVRKWECGMIENMRRDKLEKLADALNVSPLTFLDYIDVHVNGDTLELASAPVKDDGNYKRLYAVYNMLSDEGKNKVLERVDELLQLEGKAHERKEDSKR